MTSLETVKPGRWFAFAQLVRLPNVFSAWSNICLGAMVTRAFPEQIGPFFMLLLASTFLYWAGMIWNDIFDLAQDQKERSFRPLPSGRIQVKTAIGLGLGFLAAGVGCVVAADLRPEGFRRQATILALGLAGMILLYDGWWKRTGLGPPAMGCCRFLNVLLGLSVAPEWPGTWGILLGMVVGLYVTGLTWFARTEAQTSNPNALRGAAGVMLAGLLLALAVPAAAEDAGRSPTISVLFPYLLVGLGFYVGLPMVAAMQNPSPARVQAAVKKCLLALVLVDAVLATALVGIAGILLGILIFPGKFLGRWLYTT